MDNPNINELLKNDDFIEWLFTFNPNSHWNEWYESDAANKAAADKLRSELLRLPFRGVTFDAQQNELLMGRINDSIGHSKVSGVRRRILNVIKWSAAAVLVLGASLTALYSTSKKVIVASDGVQQAIVLPDGSNVRLNSGSSLSYHTFLWKMVPSVTLDGEAFFYGNHKQGFEVESEVGSVTVLGTQFNVYSRNQQYRVDCYQGKVQVEVSHSKTTQILGSGDYLSVDKLKNSSSKGHLRGAKLVPSWTLGEFYYENSSFGEVLNELERQFNISIEGKDRFDSLKYTGYFNSKDMNMALEMTLAPMGISFSTDNGKVILSAK